MNKLNSFFSENYRGTSHPAPPFKGVSGGPASDCVPAQCVCNCGGTWCSPSVQQTQQTHNK